MATSYQVFLNGVVHWIGYRYHKRGNARGRCGVLAFRIGEEVFDEISLPYELANALVSDLRVASAGELLAVLKYHGDSRQGTRCCDIWLMKEYGVESSWTKCYSVSLVEGMKKILALRNNGEALVEASSEIGLVALDLASGKTKNLGIHGRTNSFYVDNYVESLELLKCESQDLKEAGGVEEILIRIENALLFYGSTSSKKVLQILWVKEAAS